MHSIIDAKTGDRLNPAKNIIIEDHVWIAADAKIMGGTIIGSNSVVGTLSLVKSHIPKNCVCAGIPAKILRVGTSWKKDLI
jgi:acetyltransferase-like isoleucine patch superfamily enzyme